MLKIELHKELNDIYEMYLRFFSILMVMNNRHLTKSELHLISFIAVHDNISNFTTRKDYLKKYNTTRHTLNNNISDLTKKGFLIKEKDKKVRLIPSLRIGKDDSIMVQMTLKQNINAEDREGSE